MPSIPTINLRPNFAISRIVTGLWQIADMERDGGRLDSNVIVNAMAAYQMAGFTTFDMADHYGSAEIFAGQFRKSLQDGHKVQLLTKWVPSLENKTKADVRKAVERSLRRLAVDQIDHLQYHAWDYANPIWLDHLFWLAELQQEGLVSNLGLTNFDASHLKMALDSEIAICSNQISFSLLDQRAMRSMCALCENFDVKILAFGTLAGGFLTDKWLGRKEPFFGELKTWSQMKYKRYIDAAGGWDHFQKLLNLLAEIGQRSDATIAQVATKFILDQPGVASVIIGARLGESDHITENAQTFGLSIASEDKERIYSLIASGNVPGNCGDEYRKPPYLTAKGDLSDHIATLPAPFPTQKNSSQRVTCNTGTIWEGLAGYSRAIKVKNRILVSGTTATHRSKLIGGNDPASQTHFVIDKIEGALHSVGAALSDVIRTRIYIQDPDHWEPISRAHGQRFQQIRPANTLIRADLIGAGYLVEIEAEATVS